MVTPTRADTFRVRVGVGVGFYETKSWGVGLRPQVSGLWVEGWDRGLSLRVGRWG